MKTQIQSLLSKRSYTELKNVLSGLPIPDLAQTWLSFSHFQQITLFRLLDVETAVSLFHRLEKHEQWLIIETLQPGALEPILEAAGPPEVRSLFWQPDDPLFHRLIQVFRS